jgi:hypothetical protein
MACISGGMPGEFISRMATVDDHLPGRTIARVAPLSFIALATSAGVALVRSTSGPLLQAASIRPVAASK